MFDRWKTSGVRHLVTADHIRESKFSLGNTPTAHSRVATIEKGSKSDTWRVLNAIRSFVQSLKLNIFL